MTNLIISAINSDGTLDLSHYGTRYSHWWVAEIKQQRVSGKAGYVAYIYGRRGGSSLIVLTPDEVKVLETARAEAQRMAI